MQSRCNTHLKLIIKWQIYSNCRILDTIINLMNIVAEYCGFKNKHVEQNSKEYKHKICVAFYLLVAGGLQRILPNCTFSTPPPPPSIRWFPVHDTTREDHMNQKIVFSWKYHILSQHTPFAEWRLWSVKEKSTISTEIRAPPNCRYINTLFVLLKIPAAHVGIFEGLRSNYRVGEGSFILQAQGGRITPAIDVTQNMLAMCDDFQSILFFVSNHFQNALHTIDFFLSKCEYLAISPIKR